MSHQNPVSSDATPMLGIATGAVRRQRIGGGSPWALAASAGSQSQTLQACWNAERANATAAACGSADVMTLWIGLGFVVYGVFTGIVWLTYGYFPRWYAAIVVMLALVIAIPAFVLSQSQIR